MNPFEHFLVQQESMMTRRLGPSTTYQPGTRPDTPTEIAALETIKSSPDIAVGAIATALAIDAELLYPVVRRLKGHGKIIVSGRGAKGNLWRAVQC